MKDILTIFWIFVDSLASLLFLVRTINNASKEEADLVEDTFLFNDLVGLAFQTS